MHHVRFLLLFLGCCIGLNISPTAKAEDLRQVYDLALAHDPTLQGAWASLQANQQALPEAIAQLAPQLSARYTTTGSASSLTSIGKRNATDYGLVLTQPLFHPEHWAQIEQARHIQKGAMATYLSATQKLIIRVASQYFSVLGAIDDLQFTQGQRIAFARELEQTQQRFAVGLIAITDVQDAKARHNSAIANEIAAQNAVFDEYEKLREITGQPLEALMRFETTKPLPLVPPSPNASEPWVHTSHLYNLDVMSAKENAAQYKAAIGTPIAGHFPKFDLQGNFERAKNPPPFAEALHYTRSLSLNVSLPLFQGGQLLFRTKEAKARYQEALSQLEASQRTADSNTRQAFRGVLTAISSVEALEQVVLSNKTALEATKAAYQVGTRTMVDVLDAESNVLSAQRDLAKARYRYILEGLNLKQAAGTLTTFDLFSVNQLIHGKTPHEAKNHLKPIDQPSEGK